MFMSALKVMPGMSRKFSGTLWKFILSTRAARLVISLDRLAIVIGGKSAIADPAHFALSGAVLDKIERIDFHSAAIAVAAKIPRRARRFAPPLRAAYPSALA